MLTPHIPTARMVEIVREGLALYPAETPLYIRPMYWGIDCGMSAIVPGDAEPGFAICLEELPMAPEDMTVAVTTTASAAPVLESLGGQRQGRPAFTPTTPHAGRGPLPRLPERAGDRRQWATSPKAPPPTSFS